MKRSMGYLIRAAMLLVCMSVPAYLALAYFGVFEPYLVPLRYLKARAGPITDHVIVGSFADPAELATLKQSGVTTIVSLLDPTVVYERSLIERERTDTLRVGLRFVNLPIRRSELPTSAANRNSLQRLALLLNAQPQEKVYIHGFLDAPSELVLQELRDANTKSTPAKKGTAPTSG